MYQRKQRRKSSLADYSQPTTSRGLDLSGISTERSPSEDEQLKAARKAEDISQQGDWWKQGLSVGGGILGGVAGGIAGGLGAGTATGGLGAVPGAIAGAAGGYGIGSQLGGGIGDIIKSNYDKEASRQTDEMEYRQMRQQALLSALRGLM